LKIEVQWFLEGISRQHKMKKIHLKFQDFARLKNTWKRVEIAEFVHDGLPHAPLCNTLKITKNRAVTSKDMYMAFRIELWRLWSNPT